MNKKMVFSTITILAFLLFATPFVGTVQAYRHGRRCSSVFTATLRMVDPTTTPPGYGIPGSIKFFGPKNPDLVTLDNPDGRTYRMNRGGTFFGTISCDQLGEGTATFSPIIGVSNLESGMGRALFHWLFEFNNPTCAGTIEGYYRGTQEAVFPELYIEGEALLFKGTGDLKGVTIHVSNSAVLNLLTWLTEGYTATLEGMMWG